MKPVKKDRLTESIDNQIEFNRGKNIFLDNLDIFKFGKETAEAITNMSVLTAESKHSLIDYAAEKAIEEFYRVNQYYAFNLKAKDNLRKIYAELFESFEHKTNSIENISKKHYKKLRTWLKENNPFAEELYSNGKEIVNPVACSEYSPELQIDILQIDISHLMHPVLDIGCGMNGHLVKYIKNLGIEVYGIDRFRFSTSSLITADWLEYDYGKEKWGTIVSNLGFSNHFNHHNLREDGNYIAYGKAYMNILKALKVNGCFHYAPDLPFIEEYLDSSQFVLRKHEINEYNFKTTILKKLK